MLFLEEYDLEDLCRRDYVYISIGVCSNKQNNSTITSLPPTHYYHRINVSVPAGSIPTNSF